MTYEEVVQCVRSAYENADAREIYEHIAVQVNVTGEGEGAFYIEVAGRAVCVEPYDYYDRDGLITASSETIVAIAKGELELEKALEQNLIRLDGNMDKFRKLAGIKPAVSHKKHTAKAEPKKEEKAEAKAEPKKETKAEVKAEPKKETKAEAKAEPKKETKAEAKAEPKKEEKAAVKSEPKK